MFLAQAIVLFVVALSICAEALSQPFRLNLVGLKLCCVTHHMYSSDKVDHLLARLLRFPMLLQISTLRLLQELDFSYNILVGPISPSVSLDDVPDYPA